MPPKSKPGAKVAGKRRFDPDRRERIARAALEVVAEQGVEAVTHRAVAAAADVPVGSTTYHFVDREDLLLGAVEEAIADDRRRLEEWADDLGAEPNLPARLTDLIMRAGSTTREGSIVGYELYVAAGRHAGLREASAAWVRILPQLLERFVDPTTAQALAVAVEGLLLRGLTGEPSFDRDFVEAVLRRIADG